MDLGLAGPVMKVLDLQCAQGHAFEGWFASDDDFVAQQEKALVQCPLCADATITKKLSAPRLNLSSVRGDQSEPLLESQTLALDATQALDPMAAWLHMSRKLMEHTTDVGERFAEEARKIHYGEVPEHAIRGQASAKETRELLDEGIPVLPLLLPEGAKGSLQ